MSLSHTTSMLIWAITAVHTSITTLCVRNAIARVAFELTRSAHPAVRLIGAVNAIEYAIADDRIVHAGAVVTRELARF